MHLHLAPFRRRGVAPSLRRLLGFIGALAVLSSAGRAADATRAAFDLPADLAEKSLKRFSEQAGREVLFASQVTRGVQANPVKGEMPPHEALDLLLANTGLIAVPDAKTGAFSVRKETPEEKNAGSRPARSPGAGGRSQPGEAGHLSGRVSNAATSSFLEGAQVEITTLGRRTLTDSLGHYSFGNLPAGEHLITVSYLGLDTQRASVQISADLRSARDFDLTSGIYRLGEFKVTGEREGSAAAITRQRTASNVKNVVAVDAFGSLPNEAVGELLLRLPGISGDIDPQENVVSVGIRGSPAEFNTISVDGNIQANITRGLDRTFNLNYVSSAMFEELEVTKAPTPDMSGDGLGGAVNMKTRSSLNMKEKRRISYRAALRWAPSFYDHIPARRDHPAHPVLSFGYQEVFGVLGGDQNLGVSFNAFYSENVAGFFRTIKDYEFNTASPAYVYDYRTADALVNRKQKSMNLRLDYRLTDHARIYFNALYLEAPTPFNHSQTFRAFTGRTVATLNASGQPTGTGAIFPGYRDDFTQVRGVAASTVTVTSGSETFLTRQVGFTLGAKHDHDRWQLDYDAAFSRSDIDQSSSGNLALTLTAVGWTLENGRDLFPTFTQTEGRSIYDGASYANAMFTKRDAIRLNTNRNATANLRYALPTSFASSLKTGFRYRSAENEEIAVHDEQWTYVGTAPLSLLTDPSIHTSDTLRTGKPLPFATPRFVDEHIAKNPQMWRGNPYASESQYYTGTRAVMEAVTAGYVQTQARLGHLGVLAGIRMERTEVEARGNVRSRVLSTNAQREADPIAAAKADNGNPREIEGSYTNWFPGVHFTYKLSASLQARASWSNSIGRPPMSTLLPLETVNVNAETLTINNPALKPQHAEKWDASLEYYFEPVGLVSVSYFRKDLSDFIVSARGPGGVIGIGNDNGFNGDYAGYTILTLFNGGKAMIDGWEFSYQQQLSFLPGPFRGLGVFANYTVLQTAGDYGEGTAARSTDEIAGFVPKVGNAGLTYKYRGFGARLLVNYHGSSLATYAADASRLLYRADRTLVTVGASYQWSPRLEFSCDIVNLFNEPQVNYRYSPNRPSTIVRSGTTITFSVSGRY